MNSVEHILEKKFSLHTLDEKINIKTLGRPMPDLKLTQVIKKKHANLLVHLQMTLIQNIIIGYVVVIKEMQFFVFRVYYLVEN